MSISVAVDDCRDVHISASTVGEFAWIEIEADDAEIVLYCDPHHLSWIIQAFRDIKVDAQS